MNILKSVLTGILCLALAIATFAVVPTEAKAETVTTPDGIVFNMTTGYIMDYTGDASVLTVPSTINGVSVKILHGAFEDCDTLTSVIISNGLESLVNDTFKNCDNLTSVSIPQSVMKISSSAFEGCDSLIDINVNELSTCFKSIDGVVYSRDGTRLVVFPGGRSVCTVPLGVTYVMEISHNPNLVTVNMPSSVKTTAKFYGCDNLESINVDSENEKYQSIDGVLFSKSGKTLYRYPAGKTLTSYVMPNTVTLIWSKAFSSCTLLENVILPSGLKNMQQGAFEKCTSIKNINIPNNVSRIGDEAFRGCTSIEDINIPNSVRNIGYEAFRDCTALESIKLPYKVTDISGYHFFGCTSLQSINVDSDNTAYETVDGILYSKDKNVLIIYPAGKIETLYTMPDSIIIVRSGAFIQCVNLENVVYSDSVSNRGAGNFINCKSLKSVTISSTMTQLKNIFYECVNLESLIIPESVTFIDDNALDNCNNVTIFGESGSYAESFSLEKDIPFQEINHVNTVNEVIDGKLLKTVYDSNGIIRIVEYYGETASTGIAKIENYNSQSGAVTDYILFDDIERMEFYENGKQKRHNKYGSYAYNIYVYNTNGIMIKKSYYSRRSVSKLMLTKQYDYYAETGNLYAERDYYYDEGNLSKEVFFRSNGVRESCNYYGRKTANCYATSKYDSNGRPTQKQYYYSDGELKKDIYYKEGIKEHCDFYSSKTGNRFATSYYSITGKSRIVQKVYYNSDGDIIENTYYRTTGMYKRMRTEYYDSEGRIKIKSYYNTKGNIIKKTYYYDSGVRVKTRFYNTETGHHAATSYYDTSGDITKKVYYNSDGSVKETVYY